MTTGLEQIFKYLDLYDLFNVGRSNTVLQYAARIVFKHKFGRDIKISIGHFSRMKIWSNNKLVYETYSQHVIPVFGNFIHSLKLISVGVYDPQIGPTIFDKISVHPLQSLVKVKFHRFHGNWLRMFAKPMPKVQFLDSELCDLSDGTLLLSEIFPNLNHLKISCGSNAECNQILAHFPYLKELEANVKHQHLSNF